MRTRGKGLKREIWFSICSTHHNYKDDCDRCNTGEWKSAYADKVETLMYNISPILWQGIYKPNKTE